MISRWIWLSYNFVSISADRLIRILLKIDKIDFIKCKNTKVHVNDVIHEYIYNRVQKFHWFPCNYK